jgi:ubiquinone/menaquinone biosynthesis C-methylase UbiE
LWRLNLRLGWPERVRGLHYWLGFEYALVLNHLPFASGAQILDIGTGPHSIFPYLLAHLNEVQVTIVDIDPRVGRQAEIRERAIQAGFRRAHAVHIVQGDARDLPFRSGVFDGLCQLIGGS